MLVPIGDRKILSSRPFPQKSTYNMEKLPEAKMGKISKKNFFSFLISVLVKV
jgi:hypothetical protein